jgi:hypothetical protein
MLYSFFLVIPRLLNFMCRRFGRLLKRRHKQFRRRGITQKKEYNSIKFVDRSQLSQKPDQRQTLVNTVMNARAPKTAGNFLTCWNINNDNYCKLMGFPQSDYTCTVFYFTVTFCIGSPTWSASIKTCSYRGSGKSLARPTSRCRRTESIVSLERGVCSCAELQAFSCYRDWKEACQATREIGHCSLLPS